MAEFVLCVMFFAMKPLSISLYRFREPPGELANG